MASASATDCWLNCMLYRGCKTDEINGRHMRAPFTARLVSSFDHNLLQTLVSSKMYELQVPLPAGTTMGAPLLVRCDGCSLYAYGPPAWAQAGLAALMRLLA